MLARYWLWFELQITCVLFITFFLVIIVIFFTNLVNRVGPKFKIIATHRAALTIWLVTQVNFALKLHLFNAHRCKFLPILNEEKMWELLELWLLTIYSRRLFDMSLNTSDSLDSSRSRSLFFAIVALALRICLSFIDSINFFFWSSRARGTLRAILPTLTNLRASSVSVILSFFSLYSSSSYC